MADSEDYEKLIEYLKAGDGADIAQQYILSGCLQMIYEDVKYKITSKLKSFFTEPQNFEITESGEILYHPSEKYEKIVKGKSAQKACREWLVSIGALSDEDAELIVHMIDRRNEAAHNSFERFVSSSRQPLSAIEVAAYLTISRKIDQFWIQTELETDPDTDWEALDLEGSTFVNTMLVENLCTLALKEAGLWPPAEFDDAD